MSSDGRLSYPQTSIRSIPGRRQPPLEESRTFCRLRKGFINFGTNPGHLPGWSGRFWQNTREKGRNHDRRYPHPFLRPCPAPGRAVAISGRGTSLPHRAATALQGPGRARRGDRHGGGGGQSVGRRQPVDPRPGRGRPLHRGPGGPPGSRKRGLRPAVGALWRKSPVSRNPPGRIFRGKSTRPGRAPRPLWRPGRRPYACRSGEVGPEGYGPGRPGGSRAPRRRGGR